ncbi:sigma-54 interaction domain-containing protein [Emergencia sp.]|uniref:sigma-54 interaction domain-containing protein n=1 Tax=Emergencia sp. TaxID=1926557 RepID=UPI003AEF538E
MKKITVVTIKQIALNAYMQQIRGFFGEEASILGYAMEDDPLAIQGDIILTTSYFLLQSIKRKLVNDSAEIVHMSGTFSKEQFRQISDLPAGSKVLVVNSTKEIAYDCISQFKQNIETPLSYVAYSEEEDKKILPGEYDYAVTFIENFEQTDAVKRVINLGIRKIHPYIFEHVIDICYSEDEDKAKRLDQYKKEMVPVNYSMIEFSNVAGEWEEILNNIIFLTESGVIVLDDGDHIKGINDYISDLFQISRSQYYGQDIKKIFEFRELFRFVTKLGDNRDADFYLKSVEERVTIRKRIVQFYGYKFFTVIFIEVDREGRRLPEQKMKARFTFDDIRGKSPAISRVIEIARQISYSDNSVLLLGETGTGKELFSNSIHNNSQRASKPFIAVNCAAFPENLLESELFGYEPGTFTGALKNGKKGIFELADGGTVFLDEIGDAPLSIQAKLLRVLQEKEVRKIGGEESVHVDVRIISATNKDLKKMIEQEKFRKDLYYRLNTFTVNIPALRERIDDLELLIQYFLEEGHYGYKKVSPEVLSILKSCPWEGNLRELKNCVDYMAFMSDDLIKAESLPEEYLNFQSDFFIEQEPEEGLTYSDQRIVSFLLETLYYQPIGRERILRTAVEKKIELTEHHLKRILKIMSEKDYICITKGRGGIKLTKKGIEVYKKNRI